MASIIHSLAVSGSRLSDGTVNAGGRVFLTQPGSANVKVAGYADKDKTAALALNGGGYLLDAAGKAAIFIDQPCVVRIEDQSGVTVDSFSTESTTSAGLVEVVSPYFTGVDADTGQYSAGERTYLARVLASIGASHGGLDGKFKVNATATDRYIRDAINDICISVKSFGAAGNGTADDTLPIQNAINAVAALGGGTVFIPYGTYKVTSALTVNTAGISIVGQTREGSIIQNANTATMAIDATSFNATAFRISNLTISHSSASTTYAVRVNQSFSADRLVVGGHNLGLRGTNLIGSDLVVAGASGAGAAVMTITSGTLFGGSLTSSGAGDALSIGAGSGTVQLFGTTVTGGSAGYGINAGSGIYLYAYGVTGTGTTGAVKTDPATVVFFHYACRWQATVLDQRTGAPVAYSLSATNSVTPLPEQTDDVRVVGTTGGITITINGPVAMGFGRAWRLYCINSSGGAVTWSFNAIYKTTGAVNPATGNMIILVFAYDPVSSVWREISRSGTVPV